MQLINSIKLPFSAHRRAHMHLSRLGTSQELRYGRNWALACERIHEQPFPLLHYCGTGEVPSVATAGLTNDLTRSVMLQQDNATPHKGRQTVGLVMSLHWELLDHPSYCLDG